VGDSSTFGKGTIQTVIPLGELLHHHGLGSAKVTIQKFYRPSGASTQLRGVVPDIVLPSETDLPGISEAKLPGALPWDGYHFGKYCSEGSLAVAPWPSADKQSKQRVHPTELAVPASTAVASAKSATAMASAKSATAVPSTKSAAAMEPAEAAATETPDAPAMKATNPTPETTREATPPSEPSPAKPRVPESAIMTIIPTAISISVMAMPVAATITPPKIKRPVKSAAPAPPRIARSIIIVRISVGAIATVIWVSRRTVVIRVSSPVIIAGGGRLSSGRRARIGLLQRLIHLSSYHSLRSQFAAALDHRGDDIVGNPVLLEGDYFRGVRVVSKG